MFNGLGWMREKKVYDRTGGTNPNSFEALEINSYLEIVDIPMAYSVWLKETFSKKTMFLITYSDADNVKPKFEENENTRKAHKLWCPGRRCARKFDNRQTLM